MGPRWRRVELDSPFLSSIPLVRINREFSSFSL